MRPARLALATSLLAAASLALGSSAAEARMVSVGFSQFKLTEEVYVEFHITRRPPRGWYYWTAVQVEGYSAREAAASGCTEIAGGAPSRSARPFSIVFTPLPAGDSDDEPQWCPGEAFAVLYLQRNHTRSTKYSRQVAYSRMFSFVE